LKDFWRALKFVMVNKKLAFFVFFLTILSVVLSVVDPLIYKLIFDLIQKTISSGVEANTYSTFTGYIVLLVGLYIARDIVNHGTNYFIPKWVESTRKHLVATVFNHLQTLSLSYFEKNGAGKIKERVDKGVGDLTRFIEGAFLSIVPQMLYIILAIYFLFRASPQLAFIIMFGIPLFIVVTLVHNKPLRELQDKIRDAGEKSSAVTMESIINIRTIKSFVAEHKQSKKLNLRLREYYSRSMAYTFRRLGMNVFRFLIVDFAQISILAIGGLWTLKGAITLGTFTLAWQYANRSFGPLWSLTWLYDEMLREMRSIKRVFELLDTNPEVMDKPHAKKLKVSSAEIEFRNVSFVYDSKNKKQRVLNNFSLEVPPGKVLALIGKSGAGKSTLAKILMRFYEPEKGSVLIDGQDISEVTQESLRKNISVVMQDSTLFNDTAENNIRFGVKSASKDQVEKAARISHASDFIEKLPKKYKTVVGERGVKLSGGEQQRINIARAVLKDSPILILDEATSSLDSENEALIQDALWKLVEGKTTIIIAHRLSTVMRADLIVVMDKGKIVETGTHEDLIKHKGGIYKKLYKIQSGGYLK
jgi:subfamily B ATP-binding cassette protein MsbA